MSSQRQANVILKRLFAYLPSRRGGAQFSGGPNEIVRNYFWIPLDKQNNITTIVVMKTNYSRTIPKEWKAMSKVFTALGDEHRQRILLLFDREERLNVGQIVAVATITRSAVSHHLKVLKDADVLHSQKVGKEVFYWINKAFVEDTMQNVLDYLREYA